MLEIFLIFTLVAGEAKDVDSFISQDQCVEALSTWQESLKRAQAVRPELAAASLVGCVPVKVEAPKAP